MEMQLIQSFQTSKLCIASE